MDTSVRHQAFLLREVKEGSVGDPGLVGPRARVRRPSVQVCIEVDDGYRSINFVQRAKDGQNDGMVAAQAVGT